MFWPALYWNKLASSLSQTHGLLRTRTEKPAPTCLIRSRNIMTIRACHNGHKYLLISDRPAKALEICQWRVTWTIDGAGK